MASTAQGQPPHNTMHTDPPPIPATLGRRSVAAALVAFPIVWTGARALAQAPMQPTPRQAEGPFYPVDLPGDSDFDLLRNGSLAYGRGQASWLAGTVSDTAGRPVAGAQVEIWQCDADGHYHHPGDAGRADPAFQGFGRVRVAADGSYRFRTIRPAPYAGRAPHIHVKVRLERKTLLTTQLYVLGDARNAHDGLWRSLPDDAARAALGVAFLPAADGLRAFFPIVVAA